MKPNKKKKRILIFSLMYLPYASGAELAIKEITDRIPSDEYEFDVVSLRANSELPQQETIGAVTVHRVGPAKARLSFNELGRFPWYLIKVLYPLYATFKALSLHRAQRFDAVWSMMIYAGFPAVLFKILHPRVPYLLTLQDGDTLKHLAGRLRIKLVWPLFRAIFTKADFVQPISEYLSAVARNFGYRGEIALVPNGVDLSRFDYQTQKKQHKVREALNLSEDFHFIVTTSRLVEKNAVDVLIRSLSYLPDSYALLIAGVGPDETKLKDLARTLEVTTRVSFLGNLSHGEVAQLLLAADVFSRPSRSEGFGSSFIEAMAAGVPVVATAVGGITDFLFDPDTTKLGKVTPTGLFAEVDNPKHVARQVQRLMDDTKLRRDIVLNASALVREKYNWDRVAQEMQEKVFEKVLQ